MTRQAVAMPGARAVRAGWWPAWFAEAAAVVVGIAVLTASAKIELPFWPVPMTLETLAALGLGGFLGARRGAASVVAWLALGAAGLPVFAGPAAGTGYLVGPTGGYLAGLLAATLFVGWTIRRGATRHAALLLLAMLGGVAVIYLCGVSYLALAIGGKKAIAVGLIPFVPADLAKAALASALVLLYARRRNAGAAHDDDRRSAP